MVSCTNTASIGRWEKDNRVFKHLTSSKPAQLKPQDFQENATFPMESWNNNQQSFGSSLHKKSIGSQIYPDVQPWYICKAYLVSKKKDTETPQGTQNFTSLLFLICFFDHICRRRGEEEKNFYSNFNWGVGDAYPSVILSLVFYRCKQYEFGHSIENKKGDRWRWAVGSNNNKIPKNVNESEYIQWNGFALNCL